MVEKEYTVEQIAAALATNVETVRRWIRDGKLKSELRSNREGYRIKESDLQLFMHASKKYNTIANQVATNVIPGVAMVKEIGTMLKAAPDILIGTDAISTGLGTLGIASLGILAPIIGMTESRTIREIVKAEELHAKEQRSGNVVSVLSEETIECIPKVIQEKSPLDNQTKQDLLKRNMDETQKTINELTQSMIEYQQAIERCLKQIELCHKQYDLYQEQQALWNE